MPRPTSWSARSTRRQKRARVRAAEWSRSSVRPGSSGGALAVVWRDPETKARDLASRRLAACDALGNRQMRDRWAAFRFVGCRRPTVSACSGRRRQRLHLNRYRCHGAKDDVYQRPRAGFEPAAYSLGGHRWGGTRGQARVRAAKRSLQARPFRRRQRACAAPRLTGGVYPLRTLAEGC
jgi:hypothetical protein